MTKQDERDIARLDKFMEWCRESLISAGKTEEEAEAFVESIIEIQKEKHRSWAIKMADGKQYLLDKHGDRMPFLVDIYS